MKTTLNHRCHALAALAVLASLSVAHAANISMTADNAAGSSSFNSSLSWSDGLAPAAGNDYFNAGYLLRTPAVANGVYTFGGNSLTITGHRPDGCRAPKCKFLVMEIDYGSFQSVIELPQGYNLNQAKAAYQNGFLRVDVPQGVTPAKKRVTIFSGKEK